MPRALSLSLMAAATLALAGCVDVMWDTDWLTPGNKRIYPPYEGIGFTEREPTEREKLIAKSDFSIELVRFEDTRRPRSIGIDARDSVIYDYDPDQLLQSVSYKMPTLINKYLAYKPKLTKHYKAEAELLVLNSRIYTGDLLSGKMGRYTVHLEANVLVRRPDSFVAVNKLYAVNRVEKRQTFDGRPPTKEMDRARMYDLVEDAVRGMAEEVAWDLRQNDVRAWNIKEERKAPVAIRPAKPKLIQPAASTTVTDDEPTTLENLITPTQPDEPMMISPDNADTPAG